MKFRAGLGKNALHGMVATLLGGMLACSGSGHVVGADTAPVTGAGNGERSGSFAGGVPTPQEVAGLVTSCTAFPLPIDDSGMPTCDLLSVVASPTCDCTAPGLTTPSADDMAQVRVHAQIAGLCADQAECANFCACEIVPATGASLNQCASTTPDSTATGWCYVSAEQSSAASALVSSTCSLKEQHEIRFLGPPIPADTATLMINCTAGHLPANAHPAALGELCVNQDEQFPSFAGYDVSTIVIEDNVTSCLSGICLQNRFQGRASCPYGQTSADGSCLVAGSDVPVQVPVKPQLVDRQAKQASICSCQCDGDGPGPYCTCPTDMECVHLVDKLGTPAAGQRDLSGSYCIPAGTEYSKTQTSECAAGACGDTHPF